MLRTILILHRYVGVVLGVLMTLWCLSGFVMMYQSYPELLPKERLGALEPLNLAGCCNVPADGLDEDTKVSDFRIEMLGGRPTLILPPAENRPRLYDLISGDAKPAVSLFDATTTAALFGSSRGLNAPPRFVGEIDIDQWTVQNARRHLPVRLFEFPDSAGTQVYVSGATGEVIQDTTRRERVLSWFGAIPHWLYPTVLRQDRNIWGPLVIWLSSIGVFLTVTGLYVGIVRLRRLPNGRWSPFRGWWFWHHMIGLVFGVLTLTWVFSGLMTMSPWGIFEGKAGAVGEETAGVATFGDIRRTIAAAPQLADGQVVQIRAAMLNGAALMTANGDGTGERFGLDGELTPLQESDVRQALAIQPITSFEVMEAEDSYYYSHHYPAPLPVYRAVLADEAKTRVYIDAQSGEIARIVDDGGRRNRWMMAAMHSLDLPGLRKRPVWDLVLIPLLIGVTAVCVTGTWLSFQRVGRDANLVKVILRRRRKAKTTREAQQPSASR